MYSRYLLLLIGFAAVSACSGFSEQPVSALPVHSVSGCNPGCSQAFVLGTQRPVVRKPREDCNPLCP
jgi:hypothetical protein